MKKGVWTGIITAALLLAGCAQNQGQTTETTTTALSLEETTELTKNTEPQKEETTAEPASEPEKEKEPVIDEELVVSFSAPAGCYEEEFYLTLSEKSGKAIYYTTDGSDPRYSDTAIPYKEPFLVTDAAGEPDVLSAKDPVLFDTAYATYSSKTGVSTKATLPKEPVDKCRIIRAAVRDEVFSTVYCATYFVGSMAEHIRGIEESAKAAGTTLAVISLVMDEKDLFDEETGIYVKGKVFEQSLAAYLKTHGRVNPEDFRKLPANYNQKGRDWERPVHIDFLESNGTKTICAFSQEAGVRVQGNYSRSDLIKGFRLYARKDYGEKRFIYPVFGDALIADDGEMISSFKTLVLRNGGNCAFLAKFNDAYWQSLIMDLAVETQVSRPAVVYLNGEYWGLYILQEDYSQEDLADTHHLTDDTVVIYKGDAETYEKGYKLDEGDLPEGKDEDWYFSELLSFFRSHTSLQKQEDYEAFIKLVDPVSVRDYFAVELFINNKWDWPGKNWSMWRTMTEEEAALLKIKDKNKDPENPYQDGRWRFIVYDVEFGGICGGGEANANTMKEDNYKKNGMLDMGTNNPAVLCFAYLMTNEGFREDFFSFFSQLSQTNLEKEIAESRLDWFASVYGPLYEQYFERYPDTGSKEDALEGGYGSAGCIRDFLSSRAGQIEKQITWARKILE